MIARDEVNPLARWRFDDLINNWLSISARTCEKGPYGILSIFSFLDFLVAHNLEDYTIENRFEKYLLPH